MNMNISEYDISVLLVKRYIYIYICVPLNAILQSKRLHHSVPYLMYLKFFSFFSFSFIRSCFLFIGEICMVFITNYFLYIFY